MEAQAIISNLVEVLKQVDGVQALVLGGSRAKGTHHPGSDIDIGIYYDPDQGLDLAQLRRAASALDDGHRDNVMTDIGGWGSWINGGGWLQVKQMPVDFLYRDLRKVSQVMEQCHAGHLTIDYQPGHPHGFLNAIYTAEAALCKVLWDPSGLVGEMKSRMTPYPHALQKAIIEKFSGKQVFRWKSEQKASLKKIYLISPDAASGPCPA